MLRPPTTRPRGWPPAPPASAPRGVADIHVGRGQVALERGDLETARAQLAAARGLGEDRGLPQYAYRSRAVAAMLAEAEGDLAGALELVVEAQQVYLGDFSPNVRPLHAVAARLQIRLDDLDCGGAMGPRPRRDGVAGAVVPA